jgi:hypothetical protein
MIIVPQSFIAFNIESSAIAFTDNNLRLLEH